MLSIRFFLLINLFAFCALQADNFETCSWQTEMRAKALENMDKIYGFLFPRNAATYPTDPHAKQEPVFNAHKECAQFLHDHGYFSPIHPIVAKVTKSEEDIEITIRTLTMIHEKLIGKSRFQATGEILTKVLAYRDLKQGQEIFIPSLTLNEEKALISYRVDKVFNLWHGMPAFGLVPKIKGSAHPLLIYRGTQFSLISGKGLASVISDLDLKGPGFTVFQKSRQEIHDWLKRVGIGEKKAQILGFSLGGVLTAYTLLFEKELVSSDHNAPSLSFNMPGISEKSYRLWQDLNADKPPFISYVTQGDFVAKIGWLIGAVTICSLERPLYPLTAHNSIISFHPRYFLIPARP